MLNFIDNNCINQNFCLKQLKGSLEKRPKPQNYFF